MGRIYDSHARGLCIGWDQHIVIDTLTHRRPIKVDGAKVNAKPKCRPLRKCSLGKPAVPLTMAREPEMQKRRKVHITRCGFKKGVALLISVAENSL